MPQHFGLMDSVPDFRMTARSIKLNPFTSFLYWRMNWHAEHHMFAGVPCYNLKKLAREIAPDMPRLRTLWQAWAEMVQSARRQRQDATYQYQTPLPNTAHPAVLSEADVVLPEGERLATEVAASEVPQPPGVLDVDRRVQSQHLPQPRPGFLRGPAAASRLRHQYVHRVARNETYGGEDDDGDDQ